MGKWTQIPLKLLVERFQEVRFKKNVSFRHVQLGICVVMSVVGLIPAIPGFALIAFAKYVNKVNVVYSPSCSPMNPNFEPRFCKIMTWNTGLGPGFMSLENRLARPQQRVDAIIKMILEKDIDIVCMQEVFDEETTEILCRELNEKGYDCVHSVLGSSPIRLSSGLFTATKRTLNSTIVLKGIDGWQFKNLEGPDAMSSKGLLGLRFQVQNSPSNFYIFNTHLQSSYKTQGYGKIRLEQVTEIASIVKEKTGENRNVVLCGDFNYADKPLEPSDIPDIHIPLEIDGNKETHQAKESVIQHLILNAVQLFDSRINQETQDRGTFYDLENNFTRTKSIVDYIFVSLKLLLKRTSSEIIDLDGNNFASDHCPVIYAIDLTKLQDDASALDNKDNNQE